MKKLSLILSVFLGLGTYSVSGLSQLNKQYKAASTAELIYQTDDVISVDTKYVDGKVHLLLGKQIAGQDSMWYLFSEDDGETWSEPVNITEDMSVKIRTTRGNDARIAVQGDNLVAVWMTKVEGAKRNAGPMMVMTSHDAGQSWQQIASPADWDGPHGFFGLDASDEQFGLVWLDSRTKFGGGATQGLRYANSVDGGRSWSVNQTLDKRSCACCWNNARYHDDELYVIYRDKDPSDMTLGKVTTEQTWQSIASVGQFNWDFQGCPHIGGTVAFDGDIIHSTVGTGHPDHSGAYYVKSPDKGKSWLTPVRLGSDTSVHSDLDANDNAVIAAWDRITEQGFEVMMSSSIDKGQTWSIPELLSPSGKGASHPRVIMIDQQALVMWTEGQAKKPKQFKIKAVQVH